MNLSEKPNVKSMASLSRLEISPKQKKAAPMTVIPREIMFVLPTC